MSRVFISHSVDDRDFVEREIVGPLNRRTVETWYAPVSIGTAEEWDRSIRQGLEQCDWFLVVISKKSIVSRWVRAEVAWAFNNRLGRIIPVTAEPCDAGQLHLMLPQVQALDFQQDAGVAVRTLLSLFNAQDAARNVIMPRTTVILLASQHIPPRVPGSLQPSVMYAAGAEFELLGRDDEGNFEVTSVSGDQLRIPKHFGTATDPRKFFRLRGRGEMVGYLLYRRSGWYFDHVELDEATLGVTRIPVNGIESICFDSTSKATVWLASGTTRIGRFRVSGRVMGFFSPQLILPGVIASLESMKDVELVANQRPDTLYQPEWTD